MVRMFSWLCVVCLTAFCLTSLPQVGLADENDIRTQLDNLKSDNPVIVQGAMDYFKEQGSAAVEPLVQALQSVGQVDPGMPGADNHMYIEFKRRIMQALAGINDPSVKDSLMGLVDSQDMNVGNIAVEGLCLLNDEDAILVLLKKMGELNDKTSQYNSMLPAEIEALPDAQKQQYYADLQLSSTIAIGLSNAVDKISPILIKSFDDPDDQIRASAVSVLGINRESLAKKDLIPLYIKRVDDPVAQVGEAALFQLRALTDDHLADTEEFKSNRALWEAWWQQHQGEY